MCRGAKTMLGVAMILAVASARGAESRLTGEATLRAAPDNGAVLGLLTAEAPVTEIERRGEWVRVRVEGWVRSGSLSQAVTGAAAMGAAAAMPAAVAPAASVPGTPGSTAAGVPAGATLAGTLQVKLDGGLRKKKLLGTGQSVWLLPAGFAIADVAPLSAADAALVVDLETQANQLARDAERAMQGSNFTEATMRNDALMKQRRDVLERRAAILATSHGPREAAAKQAAIATAVIDSRGYFVFPAVAPGPYRVYARLATERELDLEWIESVDVVPGAKVELDETRVEGLPKGS